MANSLNKSCFIGIGSNLASPEDQIKSACDHIANHPRIQLKQVSPWYRSKAIGPGNQPDYINGVVHVHTEFNAAELLDALLQIELNHGRKREQRWAARTLDLDILLFDGQTIKTKELIIPHPRMLERNFVIRPLADIAPELLLPNQQSASDHANTLGGEGILRLDDME